jgi:hypothetical protein
MLLNLDAFEPINDLAFVRVSDYLHHCFGRQAMKIKMYQLDVEVNEQDEVIISQERRESGPTAGVVIPYDQIESLCALLTKAGEEIENRREASKEEENDRTSTGPAVRRR